MKVAVVGAGVGGLAVAGHCSLSGAETHVYDNDDSVISAIRRRGEIIVQGKEEGPAPVAATADPAEAVSGADLVVVCTQGQDLDEAVRSLSPFLEEQQTVVVMPGGTGGALVCREVTCAPGNVVFSETDAFPYGCSIPEPGVARISSVKRSFGVAAVPATDNGIALETVRQVFPQVVDGTSVLHTGLSNMNAILHVAPMLTNAGRIEHHGGGFDFYGEGVTPAVAELMAAIDRERVSVAAALEVEVPTLLGWISTTYGVTSDGIHEAIQTLSRDVYGPSPAPGSLEHRYLIEDVLCGAVPVACLGHQLVVDVSVTSDCVTLAGALLGWDPWAQGRTMTRLGLDGLSARAIRDAVF